MKKILVFICCIALCKIAAAQKDSLATDEHGKYIYYKVVNSGSAASTVLYNRALDFFTNAYDKNTLKLISQDTKTMSLSGEAIFMVSKKSAIAKHDDGRINCKVVVEVKDSRYRYWFTDFVFTPYVRDRYNNYVPQTGFDIPIEKAESKYDKKDITHYLDECAAFAKTAGKKLEQYMHGMPVAKKDTVAKKVISINKW